jgi:DNA-binding phage protein
VSADFEAAHSRQVGASWKSTAISAACRGITISGVALCTSNASEKAGIGRSYLARLETVRQDPTLSTLEKIAKALRVKVSKLIE